MSPGATQLTPAGQSNESLQLRCHSSHGTVTRELLGQKGSAIGQSALTFMEILLFVSGRLRSLGLAAFPGGFLPSKELSAQASQCCVFRQKRKRPRAMNKARIWPNIEAIGDYIYAADAHQARAAVASRFKADRPRKPIFESEILYKSLPLPLILEKVCLLCSHRRRGGYEGDWSRSSFQRCLSQSAT